jgi:hypothetical protein
MIGCVVEGYITVKKINKFIFNNTDVLKVSINSASLPAKSMIVIHLYHGFGFFKSPQSSITVSTKLST